MQGFLWTTLVFLLAAVVAVPISKRLGFGSVLGYLVAGLVIGPSGFRFITNVQDLLHFAEFGVVLLLFLIGLELEPRKLWQMRFSIFGLGGAQVLACLALFALGGRALGFSWGFSLALGMGFSLSSTALALQILNEKKILGSESGRSAFSILLFQDIAVVPMLAALPLLGAAAASPGVEKSPLRLLGVLLGVMVAGRIFLRPLLRWIASIHLREVFTALTLLLVVGMSALMQSLELSMGLGAFMAGLLLADSEYRHALETDIEPFKGLLLGMFFMSVGMSVELGQIFQHPGVVGGIVAAVVAGKILLHLLLGWIFRLPFSQLPFFALVLAQVGEFAFVLFDSARAVGILTAEERGLLVAASALSILVTPLLGKVYDYFLASRLEGGAARGEADKVESQGAPVIIAGFGRVGQIVGRFLFANGIKATVLDFEPDQVETLRRFGFKVFYGDATREDLLAAAGAKSAEILVVAIDDVDSSLRLVDMAQANFPHLRIIARARNVAHVFDLHQRGVTVWERETFDSSLRLGRQVLEHLGYQRHQSFVLAQKFRDFDHKMLARLAGERENEKVRISLSRQAREDIERMFAEEEQRARHADEGWGAYDR